MSRPKLDLWPAAISTSDIHAPVTILREQAELLKEKTGGIVHASVSTASNPDGTLVHAFHLVVPAFENYMYGLFMVKHGIEFYPLEFSYRGEPYREAVHSEEEFIAALKKMLSSEDTLRIIRSLIAQVDKSAKRAS